MGAPSGDRVHVWHARWAMSVGPDHDLSNAERARAARLVHAEARARFVGGRLALRNILAGYLDCAPADVPLNVGTHGKPGLDHTLPLHFNASHSGDVVVVAVAARPVGIDIERIDRHTGAEVIAARYFAEDEAATLAASGSDRIERFVALWARKESVLKALGDGLVTPLRDFSVSVPPAPPRILSARDARLAPDCWTLADLVVDDGYVGSVALSGRTVTLENRVWPAALTETRTA